MVSDATHTWGTMAYSIVVVDDEPSFLDVARTVLSQHPGDAIAVAAKEVGALAGIGVRFAAAELGFRQIEHDGIDAEFVEKPDDVGTRLGHDFVRKKVPGAEDDTKSEGGGFHERVEKKNAPGRTRRGKRSVAQ